MTKNNNNKTGTVKKTYDLDSTSGRAFICQSFAHIFILECKEAGQPIKSINGKLMRYNKGIYEDSEEDRAFMKKAIKDIGTREGVTLPTSLIDQTLRLVELDTLIKFSDCEPDKDFVIIANNGIIDMRDWSFKPFDPEKVYFSKIPVDYIEGVKKPENFMNFIDTCFKGNEQQKDLLQEAFGYCLTKNYKYQDIFYICGEGGNGKGSAMRILTEMLGSDNISSFTLKQLSDVNNVEYNIAMLHGKHANICGDVGKDGAFNTEHIKRLSSNTDPIQGRHVREKPFQFINYAKLFFVMNRAPKTTAHTTGDNRRIRTINFVNSFSEKKSEIKDIHKVIIDAGEMPGVLMWALEGLKRLEKNQEFTDTRTIAQRAIEYEKKSETMRYFIEEMIEEDIGGMLPREILLEQYSKFVQKVGGAQLGQNDFKKEFLSECKEAGWNAVYCKQERLKVLGSEAEKVLREDYNIIRDRGYIYHGVSLIKNETEPQKTINKFNSQSQNIKPSVVGSVSVCNSDLELYEAMIKEQDQETA